MSAPWMWQSISNGSRLIVTGWVVKEYNIQLFYTKLAALVACILNSCIIIKHFFPVLRHRGVLNYGNIINKKVF